MATAWKNRIVGTGEVAPDQLLANPRNWRQHPPAQRDALRGSLGEVGWVQQVLVNTVTGYVVDGHARVEEALSRGEAKVPVLYVELTPEEEATVLATLDPISAMATTNDERLQELLAEVDVTDEGLQRLLDDLAGVRAQEGLTHPDEVPDVPAEPYVKSGELWLLGEHRVLCGDSTKAEDVARLLDGASVDVILTDPPYGISLDTDYTGMRGSKKLKKMMAEKGGPRYVKANNYRPVEQDDRPFDARPVLAALGEVPEQFWFGANYYRRTLSDSDLDGSWLVWDKRKDNLDTVIGSGFELVWSRRHHKQDVLRYLWSGFTARNPDQDRSHPTEKPVALLGELLTRWTPAGCVVADPFAGSGTTLIAAEQLGRRCYAIEIDPRYVQVAIERWQAFTGKEAQRDG